MTEEAGEGQESTWYGNQGNSLELIVPEWVQGRVGIRDGSTLGPVGTVRMRPPRWEAYQEEL